jgi:hypothetical protein
MKQFYSVLIGIVVVAIIFAVVYYTSGGHNYLTYTK